MTDLLRYCCRIRKRALIFLCLTLFFVTSHFVWTRNQLNWKIRENRLKHGSPIQRSVCHPPADDDSLFERSASNESLICQSYDVVIANLDQKSGRLSLDLKAIENLNIHCYYSFFDWDSRKNRVTYFQGLNNSFPTTGWIDMTVDNNHANVSCYDGKGDRIFYNTYLWIPNLSPGRKTEFSSPSKPSVIHLHFDNLSDPVFHKLMKETATEMGKLLFLPFDNFLSLDNDSNRNLRALMTGRPQISHSKRQTNTLWHRFKANGYVTGLLQDVTDEIESLRYSPIDFGSIAFWEQIRDETRHETGRRSLCYGLNGSKIGIFLDQVRQFADTNHWRAFFLFARYSGMRDEDLHMWKDLDHDVADFVKQLRIIRKNTVIVMTGSDTSHQNDSQPSTPSSRLNFLSVLIPRDVSRKYPHLRKWMVYNSQKLISWPDIHLMLQDFAYGSFRNINTQIKDRSLPMNPVRDTASKDRTCDDVGIPDEYCICRDSLYLNQ